MDHLLDTECPTLSDPANGEVTITGTAIGSTATYSCDPGYELSSGGQQFIFTCEMPDGNADANWDGAIPTCHGETIIYGNDGWEGVGTNSWGPNLMRAPKPE